MAVALEVTGTLACTCPTLPPPKVTLERPDVVSTEEIQQVYSDMSAEEVKQPLQKAIVLDTLGPWRASGGWGSGHHPYAKNFLIDTHPKFIVEDANSLHTWIRYDLLVDFNRYPIAVMRYRARNLTDKGWYSIWMDDGTGPAGRGVVVFDLSELIDDGETHELRRDLRELKPKGPITGMALSVYSDNVPAVFELLEFRFEEAAEPSASLVTMTALGVMFEFRPPAGSSGWTDMELYEHGGEMLAAFSCPHAGEPIQIWLAEPVDQNDPAKYYLRYRIRITAAPSPKWRVIGLSRMPKTTNKTSDKNTPSTPVPARDMNLKIQMSHGPVKDGLAAFLLCERKQFRIGQPIPVLQGVVYGGHEKHMTIQAPYPAWVPNLVSWFSVRGPDGKDIPYTGPEPKLMPPNPKNTLRLRRHGFCGIDWPDIRWGHKLSKPGAYTIKWHYRSPAGDGGSWWTGELVSNEIQIEILAVDDCELESSRKTLLRKDLTTRYGLWVPADDPRLKAIEQLRSAASPEAVPILREFLTAHRVNCQELKQHALVALGKIGTQSAIEAVRQFEAWGKKRFTKPPPFRFGFKDHAIDHFAPHNLTPLAKTTDEKNRTWAIFQWKRHSAVAEIWICKSLEGDLWSQPILLDLPGIPEFYPFSHTYRRWDDKCSFQVKNGSLKIVVDGQIKESRISDHLVDSDKDGLPDAVEARLLTDPRKPDSDKDSLPDGKDSNPLTPKHSDANDVMEIRQAVFSALCATGNSQDAVVIVDRGDFAKQEYYGYGGAVLRSPQTRNGFINITGIRVKIESPTTATAIISDWEGNLAASVHEAKLKKINGKWVVVEFKMTLIA